MTQGLQLSMLTVGADSANWLDSTDADVAAESGQDFGDVLGQLTQSAKSSPGTAADRQIPAGISVLSSVSQALLLANGQAADADAGENGDSTESSAEDITALAESLLGQIALKDKAKTADNAGSGTIAPASDFAISHDTKTKPGLIITLADVGTKFDPTSDPEVTATTDKGNKSKQSVVVLNREYKLHEMLPKNGDSLTESEQQKLLNLAVTAKETPGNLTDTQLHKPASDVAKLVVTDPALNTDVELQADIELSVPVTTAQLGKQRSDQSEVSARPSQELPKQQELAEDVVKQNQLDGKWVATSGNDIAPSAADKVNGTDNIRPDDKTITTSAVEDVEPADTKQLNKSAVVLTVDSVVHADDIRAREKVVTASENTELGDINPVTKAVTVQSANSEKSSGPLQSSQQGQYQQGTSQKDSSGQGQSHQGQSEQGHSQQSLRQQLSESQLVADNISSQGNNRTTPEMASTSKTETVFGQSLQAAEQRQQQADVQKVVSKSPAEQLKQSLNLLQQDAATNLRERVTLMVRQNIQVAEIRLDPQGLGQMQIKIDMQQDQASVQFIVQQPQAKELLEQQLPRLREMLQQQGIQLTEGQVQQQTQQQERQMAQRDSGRVNGTSGNADGTEDSAAVAVQVNVSHSERLVDYYA